jgi:endothelin-converting enzyme/putative endopeptidase
MFPAEAKQRENDKKHLYCFENRINNLAWMSETKVSAVEKLHMSKIKIGYPDKWKDYSALVIKSPEEGGTYFENTKTWQMAL